MILKIQSGPVGMSLDLGNELFTHLSPSELEQFESMFQDRFEPTLELLSKQIHGAFLTGPLMGIYFMGLQQKLFELGNAQLEVISRVESGEDPLAIWIELLSTFDLDDFEGSAFNDFINGLDID